MPTTQRKRTIPTRLIAETTFGPLVGTRWVRGVVKTKPFGLCFAELRAAYDQGEYEDFERRQFLLLGQLIASDRRRLRDFMGSLLTFAYGSQSIRGFESLLLTAAHMCCLAADQRMYRSALRLFERAYRPPVKLKGSSDRPNVYFIDRQFNLGTVMTGKMFERIESGLIRKVLDGGDIGSAIRGFGPGYASDGALRDRVGIISGFVEVGAIAGAMLGVGAGLAVAGPGGGAAGAKLGAEVGAIIGGMIGFVWGGIEADSAENEKDKSDGSGPPVSNSDSGSGPGSASGSVGNTTAGGVDEETEEIREGEEDTDDEGTVETALAYPVPDDWLFRSGMVELVSTPLPEGDGTETGTGIAPGVGPPRDPIARVSLATTPAPEDDGDPAHPPGNIGGPKPALLHAASATFALHGFNMLSGGSRLEQMPFRLAS